MTEEGKRIVKLMTPLTFLVLLSGPAFGDTWTCAVPYDEVNGGGTVTIDDDRLEFASNWPHREPVVLKCTRVGGTSECLSARLSDTRTGGAAVVSMLYSVDWHNDGPPAAITTRQSTVLFGARDEGSEMIGSFPSIGYRFPVTDCTSD